MIQYPTKKIRMSTLKNISIKLQVLLLVTISLIVLSVILASVSVSESKSALMKKSYDSLTSARDSKAIQIQNFFAERIGDINVISESKNVKEQVNKKAMERKPNIRLPGNLPSIKPELIRGMITKYQEKISMFIKNRREHINTPSVYFEEDDESDDLTALED